VVRHDQGTFTWEVKEEQSIVVRIQGVRLRGVLRLERSSEGWTVALEGGGAG
jgi:hypothetical protein